jgi:hypothetical protein
MCDEIPMIEGGTVGVGRGHGHLIGECGLGMSYGGRDFMAEPAAIVLESPVCHLPSPV